MKWYNKPWFTVLMLILFFPVGLYLMWKNEHFGKKLRTGITGFLVLGLMISVFSDSDATDDTLGVSNEIEEVETEVASVEKDKEGEVSNLESESSESFKKERDLKVHYIDVGQGDSIFIELPNGQNALIDGGPGVNQHHLLKYLKGLKFHSIDYLIATHPHEDHIGGLPEVIRNFKVGQVFMPNKAHTTNIYKELLTEIQKRDYPVIKTETGTTLIDEPGLRLRALAPDPNTSSSNLNDFSIVLRLDFNNNSFLFTGDGETSTEQYLLADNSDEELKVNVLKVGHHGSDTSSIQPFINKVNPEHSVISCGKGNSYGHPTPSVIARLEDANTEIYRTDTDGTIIATGDGEKITFVKKGNPIEPNAPPQKAKQEVKAEPKPIPTTESKDSGGSGGGGSSSGGSTQTGQGEVFVTPTGSKYHKKACGKGNYSATTLEKAKSRGLEPCKKCY